MKIYVASSWRNPHQQSVVAALREDGHDVYDFRNPSDGDHGFSWSEINTRWKEWTAEEYIASLEHPIAEHGFDLDFSAMKWCDVCVMVLPCGASAHTEAGWCKGAGKKTAALVLDRHPSDGHSMKLTHCDKCKFVNAIGCQLARMYHSERRGWEPELMYKIHDLVTPSLNELRDWLRILDLSEAVGAEEFVSIR